jgi:hypothetical protein
LGSSFLKLVKKEFFDFAVEVFWLLYRLVLRSIEIVTQKH